MAKTASRYVNLVIYFITSYFISASGVLAQASRPENPPVSQAVYQEAKTLFAKFEKEHGEFILTKNTRMHYLSWGDSKSVPFIWCHGSLTNSYEFAGIADSLVKAGYWVIAIDYYGHGQTPIPNHPVSLYHIADDIRELMNQLNIKKAVIGGWSRGGAVATAFYDAYPESVLGIILEDGGSVSINTGYHRMEQKMLDSTINKIVSSFVAETTYKTEFDAYSAIYDP